MTKRTDAARRRLHLAWLNQEGAADALADTTRAMHDQHGRGFWMIGPAEQAASPLLAELLFIPADGLDRMGLDESDWTREVHAMVRGMLDTYDPARQVVIVFQDDDGHVSGYKVRATT